MGPGSASTSGYTNGHSSKSPNVSLYHKYRRSYGHFIDSMKLRRPYWIFKNATGRNFAHPPENVFLDNYELISIDRKIKISDPFESHFAE